MEEFDPMKVYSYTPQQAADYIFAGSLTKEDLYQLGYPAAKRAELEQIINAKTRLPIEDDETWAWASRIDTVDSYDQYLAKYDVFGEGAYRGKYVTDANMRRNQLFAEAEQLRTDLFTAMKEKPWVFKDDAINLLINGNSDPSIRQALRNHRDVASRFICTGQTISFDDIIEHGIVPSDWDLDKIMAPDFALPQTNIEELGEFPISGRTDVYFLGVPRGGKSTVLSGLVHEMFRRGMSTYEPQFNKNGQDKSHPYYRGLIKAVDAAKFPVSTNQDSVSFMKITLNNGKKKNPLTFVEIAGEAFRSIANGNETGAEIWQKLGAAQCLKSRNRKFLAFIVDYSINKKGVRTDGWTNLDQAMVLSDSLNVLGHDGTGRDNTTDCTLSKVDTVAVIVTKSDLMGDHLTPQQKQQVANQYLATNFMEFMNNLSDACRRHGINKPNSYMPYILTFNIGKLRIGNTYTYDPTDSANIINFIQRVTATEDKRKWGIF